jgi:transcriptional regulator with XRE-family HTH domain
MGKIQTNKTLERLIDYWQIHRHFDANIADLAKYTRVSRDTVYRWLNRKALPKNQKLKLIEEWLNQKSPQE